MIELARSMTLFCYATSVLTMLYAISTGERWPLIMSSIVGLAGMGFGLTAIGAAKRRGDS